MIIFNSTTEAEVGGDRTNWLGFCDSLKAHSLDIIVYSLFLLDLLAVAQFISSWKSEA